MDLHSAWQSFNKEAAAQPELTKKEMENAIRKDSALPLNGLRKRLMTKLGYLVFFTLCYIGLTLYLAPGVVQTLFAAIVAVHALFIMLFILEIRKLHGDTLPDASLLHTLQHQYRHMQKALTYERWYGRVVYPIIIPASILLGQIVSNPAGEVLITTEKLLYMLLLVAVLGPLAHWAAKKMNDYAFGAYLKQLRNNIERLKAA